MFNHIVTVSFSQPATATGGSELLSACVERPGLAPTADRGRAEQSGALGYVSCAHVRNVL